MASATPSATGSQAAAKLKESANAKHKAGDYEGAIAEYTAAIELAPSSQLFSNRALSNLQLKRWADALDDCTRALALDGDNTKAAVRSARALAALGRVEDALKSIATACVRDPRDEGARAEKNAITGVQRSLRLIAEYTASRDFTRALGLLDSVLESCPAAFDLYLNKLDLLVSARKLDEAYTLSSDMLKNKFGDRSVRGDDDAATASGASRTGKHNPEHDPRLLLSRARILNLQGNVSMAQKHLSEALRVDPDNAAVVRLLRAIRKSEALKSGGNDHFKAGRWQEAIAAYSECLDLDPTDDNAALASKVYANRAAAYMKLGKASAAFEDCSKCIGLDEGYAKAYIRRAQAGVALGDVDHLEGAVRDYNKAKELCGEADGDVQREVAKGLRDAKAALRKARRKDYYAILAVSKDADEDELKKAYRKAALKWHPDRHSTAEEEDKKKAEAVFKDVSEAYAVLNDPTKRRQYDAGATFNASGDVDMSDEHEGHSHGFGGHGHGHGGMPGGIPMDVFEMFMNGGMGGMGGGGMPFGGAMPRRTARK